MMVLCSLQDSDPCSEWESLAVAVFVWALSALVGQVPPGSAAYHSAFLVLVLTVADLSYKEKTNAVLRKRK